MATARNGAAVRPGILTALLTALLAVAGLTVPAPARAGTVSGNAVSAVRTASAAGYRSAIAVYDTATGRSWAAGDHTATYPSESVMKVFIATRLLLEGQMSGWTESTAYLLITRSDDAAANALYARAGGDAVIEWIKQHYGVPLLGAPPPRAGWWGGTRITASGLVQLYDKIRHDPKVWPWLGAAMHAATEYGSDGTWQFFGIPSATKNAAVKQGWGADGGNGNPTFNSTGLVNGDRYAVAILTQGPVYGQPLADMLTRQARALMPGGAITPPAASPVGRFDQVNVSNDRVRLSGWAFDPDDTAAAIQVAVYDNDRGIAWFPTGRDRADVNAAYGIGGAHGFVIDLALAPGAHKLCVFAINVGPAAPNPLLGCRGATVASPLSRAAVMRMLYDRAHPGTTPAACRAAPFSDVAVSSEQCGVIAWAVRAGIASGYADGGFHPSDPVTRRAAAAFLHRATHSGRNAPSCTNRPFPDVVPGTGLCGAIAWMAADGISTGYVDGRFYPGRWVTRYAMTTFLLRIGPPPAVAAGEPAPTVAAPSTAAAPTPSPTRAGQAVPAPEPTGSAPAGASPAPSATG